MRSTFDKLSRILTMEREQGCPDRVVIGGLGKFLPFWIKEAQEGARTPELTQLVRDIIVLLEGYGQRERQARVQAVDQALELLSRGQKVSQAAPAPVDPPQPQAEPALTQDARGARMAPPSRPSRPASSVQDLDQPVTALHGVSATYAKRLERLGVSSIRDLLYLLPRRYDDYSSLKPIGQLQYGEEVTLVATIWDTKTRQARNGLQITTCILADPTGTIEVTWFNQPYLASRLRPGREIVISGKVEEYLGRLTFQSPTWEPLEREQLHTARLVPVYPLTEGIGERWLRRLIKDALDGFVNQLPDPLPSAVRSQENLPDLITALRSMHFPRDRASLEQARRRLCFEEFLLIQLGVMRKRSQWRSRQAIALPIRPALDRFLAGLPFRLTGAQQRAWATITADLEGTVPMSRLLQGDVGSGKTVVAAAGLLQAVANGYQAALMAPTEILAGQHFETICRLIGELAIDRDGQPEQPVRVALLTGGLKTREKRHKR